MSTTQTEALRLAEQYDHGDPAAHGNAWKVAVCNELRRLHAENADLRAQLAERTAPGTAIGVTCYTAADMATASAQGFRDGVASLAANAGSEPVYQARYRGGFWQDSSRERFEYLKHPENTLAEDWETRPLYTHPSPPEGMGAAREPQAGCVVIGEKFQRAWLRLDELPGTMMIGPEGRFGPVPASTSAWVTTSDSERARHLAEGKPMLEVWLTPPSSAQREVSNG